MSDTHVAEELATALGSSTPSTDLEVLATTAIRKITEGEIDLQAILKTITPAPAAPALPAAPPLPAVITEDQRKALDRLHEVFGKVVPTDRRALQPAEVTALVDERMTLDEIEKLASKRKEGIRTAVCNHLDVEAEEDGNIPEDATRDKDGHYVLPGKVPAPDLGKAFSREVRAGTPHITADGLKALVDSGDLSHEDYLEMTTQVRVVDENKIMLRLRKNPDLVRALQKATTPVGKTASVYLRKA